MQMFNLENILTSRQTGSKSTEKTVTAFYDLVESYFPLYGKIEQNEKLLLIDEIIEFNFLVKCSLMNTSESWNERIE